VAGSDVTLTCQEFDLLALLAVRKDTVVPLGVLTEWLWEANGRACELRLRAAIRTLRANVSGSDPYQVSPVAGHGYGLLETSRTGPSLPLA